MLISFSLENWMSFKEQVSFNMVATRERQHGNRIARINKYKARVLPVAVLYGGNASGKTNFFNAISFVKKMVVKGTGAEPNRMIDLVPFRLDDFSSNNPSRFIMEILVNETIYEFSFAVTRKEVVEERLVEVSGSGERVLYDRQGSKSFFDKTLKKNQALKYAFQGTRDNQLFLTNSVSQKIDVFRHVYDWFKDNLVLIAPHSEYMRYEHFFDEESHLHSSMNEALPLLDAGMVKLAGEEILFESTLLPSDLKKRIREEIEEGKSIKARSFIDDSWYIITMIKGELVTKKLFAFHEGFDGKEIKFEMRDEADGTRRIIDLLPAFLDLAAGGSKRVYIIDEVDRSLHTLLSRQLLEYYLERCSKDTRSQLLVTTHDLLLMDQDILRRDEMWVTERKSDGRTFLIPFSDYKDVRSDKDIRKSYLQGRFGGVPRLKLNSLSDSCKEER